MTSESLHLSERIDRPADEVVGASRIERDNTDSPTLPTARCHSGTFPIPGSEPMTHALPFLTVHADLQFLVLESEPGAASAAVSGWLDAGLVVRVVRGRKMRTRQGLFDEFGAALQFPSYFGENADAFDECLTDLGWLPPQNGYVIVITDPGQVLAEAGPGAFGVLVAQLEFAAGEWSRLIGQGEWWDRPPVPFHVVLQPGVGEAAAVTQQWSNAGATVAPFPS